MIYCNETIRSQSGAALIVSLVILLLMTMIGTFAMRTTVMEEKMAANQRDHEMAMMAAEIALRDAEKVIISWPELPIATDSADNNNVWNRNAMDPDQTNANVWWDERNASWWKTYGIASTKPANVAEAPRYIIEELQSVDVERGEGIASNKATLHYYRVTARGVGASSLATVLLQSTVVVEE